MILGDVEETITTVELDEETFEEMYKVCVGGVPCIGMCWRGPLYWYVLEGSLLLVCVGGVPGIGMCWRGPWYWYVLEESLVLVCIGGVPCVYSNYLNNTSHCNSDGGFFCVIGDTLFYILFKCRARREAFRCYLSEGMESFSCPRPSEEAYSAEPIVTCTLFPHFMFHSLSSAF